MDLRERLIDFCDWLFKENEDWDIGDWEIDDYLKSINSGLNETQAVRQNEDAESNFGKYQDLGDSYTIGDYDDESDKK